VLVSADLRADAPPGRYTIGTGTTAGTAFDTKTNLLWQQNYPTTPASFTWQQAQTYCQTLSLGGFSSGWRMPGVKELLSLVDNNATSSPAVDQTTFPGAGTLFWTATPYAGLSGSAWYVAFDHGDANSNPTTPNGVDITVRCVCDAQHCPMQ
jgi:hypothetical protein